jgi:type VI secretion system protein ImpK
MRLSDTFMELMSYTTHLLQEFKDRKPVDYEHVRQQYAALYRRSLKQAQADGYLDKDWQEAWFAVSVWIDEMILCADWSEKDKWQRKQLQLEYFETLNGGEEFFTRLSALSPSQGQIREVYLYCLAMGFKGRFYSPEDEEKLTKIQQDNLLLIHESPELVITSKTLFPEAYDSAAITTRRPVWHYGLSMFHLIIMFISLLFVVLMFGFFKNNLDQLIQAYL